MEMQVCEAAVAVSNPTQTTHDSGLQSGDHAAQGLQISRRALMVYWTERKGKGFSKVSACDVFSSLSC